MKQYHVQPIGYAHVGDSGFYLQLEPQYIPALQGLEGFSHLSVLWWFSEFDAPEYRSVLETPQPYIHGPETLGIFATRSPVRPNPLALTAVEVTDIDYATGRIGLTYFDAHDGTPVLDIKPYTPSADRVEAPQTPEWCRHWPQSVEASGDFDWGSVFQF